MRTLVISDIHGELDKFNKLLKIIGYNPDRDQLILLGDYVDRGFQSRQVIDEVIRLRQLGAIVLRGNHEQLMLDAFNNYEDEAWLTNGGLSTFFSYVGNGWFGDDDMFDWERYREGKEYIQARFADHIEFLKSLPYYWEDENHIYVHAGIDPFYGEHWKYQPSESFLWIRTHFIDYPTKVNKKVVFGHTPTIKLNEDGSARIWFNDNKIGIDGGACFGYQLNCLEIVDGHYMEYHDKEL